MGSFSASMVPEEKHTPAMPHLLLNVLHSCVVVSVQAAVSTNPQCKGAVHQIIHQVLHIGPEVVPIALPHAEASFLQDAARLCSMTSCSKSHL